MRKYDWAAGGCAVALAATLVAGGGTASKAADTAANPAVPNPAVRSGSLGRDFADAARESGVPLPVLAALAYEESAWDPHGGAPSTSGGYGIMQVTDLARATEAGSADGDGVDPDSPQAAAIAHDPALTTAETSARLIGEPTAVVERDDAANIRAGAALLASYAHRYSGDWYAAVAEYSGATDAPTARAFADRVFADVRHGLSARGYVLPASAGRIRTGSRAKRGESAGLGAPRSAGSADAAGATDPAIASSLARLNLPAAPPVTAAAPAPECPADLGCDFQPAALKLNDPSDLSSYGDYDPANRPSGSPIRYIVIHDTEGSYASAVKTFQNPRSYASANYVIRSSDGHVTQTVPTRDIAWDSGNWSIYQHSVSIEHEAWALHGATWYTEAQYKTTADLVRYLAKRFGVPLDRQHIFGHDEVPGSRDAKQATQHWDPGPFWDWAHLMDLLGAPIPAAGSSTDGSGGSGGGSSGDGGYTDAGAADDPAAIPVGGVVVVHPDFASNDQVVSGCVDRIDATAGAVQGQCGEQPAQASNFVWLRTSPDPSAPLVSDPYLHATGKPGTDSVSDWGDKADTGEEFVVSGHRTTASGNWTAIWYAGHEVWFLNPQSSPTAFATGGLVVSPRPGLSSVPVYATAAPERPAWPSVIANTALHTSEVFTKYSIPAGQAYVADGPAIAAGFWYARAIDGSAPMDRTEVVGKSRFYLITFNHRMAWVNAADVVARAAS